MKLILHSDPECGIDFTGARHDKLGRRYLAKFFPDSHQVVEVPDETAQRWNDARCAWHLAQEEMEREFDASRQRQLQEGKR